MEERERDGVLLQERTERIPDAALFACRSEKANEKYSALRLDHRSPYLSHILLIIFNCSNLGVQAATNTTTSTTATSAATTTTCPNCAALHREPCNVDWGQCGPCEYGYHSLKGNNGPLGNDECGMSTCADVRLKGRGQAEEGWQTTNLRLLETETAWRVVFVAELTALRCVSTDDDS